MRTSDFYQECEKKQLLENRKSNPLTQAFYSLLRSKAELHGMDALKVAVSSALDVSYDAKEFSFPWMLEKEKKHSFDCLIRFFTWLKKAEIVASDIALTLPWDGVSGGCIESNLPYIVREGRETRAVFVRCRKADKSYKGKSYHTCIQTDLDPLIAKLLLEKEYPGIVIQVVYLLSERDDEKITGELIGGQTRTANIFRLDYKDHYDEAGLNEEEMTELLSEVLAMPLPSGCYGCTVASICKSEGIYAGNAVQKNSQEEEYRLPEYTNAQDEVIHHVDGPMLVCAGPGSGKTATLVGRVKYLIEEKGIAPENLLVITFTREAAGELKRRCMSFCEEWSVPKISTINALGYEILRTHGELVEEGTEVLSATEKMEIIKNLLHAFPPLTGFSYAMENGRNGLFKTVERKLDSYFSLGKDKFYQKEPKLGNDFSEFAEQYLAIIRGRGLITFDEQVILCNKLFREHPEVLSIYRSIYRYVMVDEYQDVNAEQRDFVYAITGKRGNLVVVGDDDQALYGFRGASNRFMLSFQTDFPMAKRVVLTENFRSTGAIVAASQGVIAKNSARIKKDIRAVRENGAKPVVIAGCDSTAFDTAVKDCVKEGYSYSDIAILSTKNAPLEELHRGMNTPTVLSKNYLRSTSLFQFILCALSLSNEPSDDLMLSRYLFLCGKGTNAGEIRKLYPPIDDIDAYALSEPSVKDPDGVYSALRNLAQAIGVIRMSEDLRVIFLNLAYFLHLEESSSLSALNELIESQRIATKEALLEHMLYMVEFEDDTRCEVDPSDAVMLITAHESKGKEYPVVLLKDDFGDCTEEARRVFYVALTRAKDRIYVLSDNISGEFIKELTAA